MTAVDLLHERVLPFYDHYGVALERVLTDNVLHPLSTAMPAQASAEACLVHAPIVYSRAARTPPAVFHATRVPC